MDLNGDGKLDLLTNSFDGGVYLLEGLGKGAFKEPRPLLDRKGNRILLGTYWDYEKEAWSEREASCFFNEHAVSVTTVDWDEDGDFDLLVGARSGRIFLRANEGDAGHPAFAEHPVPVRVVPGRDIMIVTADWNSDGRWDIVSGTAGGAVYWLKNTGAAGAPRFAGQARMLVKPAKGEGTSGGAMLRPGAHVQVSVGDYNADGRPDLLVGDYQSRTTKLSDLAPDWSKKFEALLEEYRVLREALDTLKDADENDPRRKKIEKRRREVRKELAETGPHREHHGWVWLFTRR